MKPAGPLLVVLVILFSGAGCSPALREAPALPGADRPISAIEAEARYLEALELFGTRQEEAVRRAGRLLRESAAALDDGSPALLALVELLVWQVEHEPDAAAREDLAEGAVHAGQWCLESAPEQPACRYRLAIAVGVQARERPGTGLDAMKVMVELLEEARVADPGFDHGGPDRVLALLYLRAPGWPAGPGDADLGHEHALAAVALDPGFPPNHLVLGEALEAVELEDEALKAYRAALVLAEGMRESRGRDAAEWVQEAESALARIGA